MEPVGTPERAPVTRQAIVRAALELLADGGLEAVSFRRIATRLGVSAPTLYWHVDSKRQLMDLMTDELTRRDEGAAGPAAGQPWWEWLRDDALRMFRTLVATRDAPRVLAGNRPGTESFPGIERALGVLVAAGMTPGEAQQALFAVGAYVIGSATEWQAEAEREAAAPHPGPPGGADALAGQPLMAAAVRELAAQPHSATFEFGLDLLVGGLRARFARERDAPPSVWQIRAGEEDHRATRPGPGTGGQQTR
ncbi:TetR/AcrR family transcriptional regulator C-terminal domain-containing protein [Modestobacter sp. NPDC049651]|uniref:TetR/AcrR family transcriptional regulator C-terminal domain-containing protein n=1 Tax=unclassified Modestobacter TaxID=2643866 RepID=UPI0033D0F9D6